MKDSLGERIKNNYENRTRFMLPRRTYTIIRLDGKAFHTFTKQFKRPYDEDFMKMMDETAIALCGQIQGTKLAYVQSDEITLVLTDFEQFTTDAWFDGNIQKIASVSASIATTAFNSSYLGFLLSNSDDSNKNIIVDNLLSQKQKLANFDSRVFSLSDYEEVINTLIWRQRDAIKNAIQSLAQSQFSSKELHGKNTSTLQTMLLHKNIDFEQQPVGFQRGRFIQKISCNVPESDNNGKKIPEHTRTKWIKVDPPIFSDNRNFLYDIIPKIGDSK